MANLSEKGDTNACNGDTNPIDVLLYISIYKVICIYFTYNFPRESYELLHANAFENKRRNEQLLNGSNQNLLKKEIWTALKTHWRHLIHD